MAHLENEVGRFLGDIFGEACCSPAGECRVPPMNVREDERSVRLELPMPGLTEKEIDVSFVGDELTIRGVAKEEEAGTEGYLRREWETVPYARSVRIQVPVDPNQVTARYRNGVLTVVLGKTKEALPRKIEIQGA